MERNLVTLDLLAATGIRAGELIRMNLEGVKNVGTIHVRSEKGEKDRYVPNPAGLQEHVKEYIEKFRMPFDARALLTTDQGRMPYEYIRTNDQETRCQGRIARIASPLVQTFLRNVYVQNN